MDWFTRFASWVSSTFGIGTGSVLTPDVELLDDTSAGPVTYNDFLKKSAYGRELLGLSSTISSSSATSSTSTSTSMKIPTWVYIFILFLILKK